MDVCRTGFTDQFLRMVPGIVVGVAMQNGFRAPGPYRIDLDLRGRYRHDDGRATAQPLRCERHALGMVAGRGGDHAGRQSLAGKARHFVVGPAQLEGENRLQVFPLEQDAVADAGGQGGCEIEGGFVGDVVHPRSENRGEIIEIFVFHERNGRAVGPDLRDNRRKISRPRRFVEIGVCGYACRSDLSAIRRQAGQRMNMDQNGMKRAVARAAIDFVPQGVIGVGTGSTANFFIDELAAVKSRIDGAVASSEATASRLRAHGIAVLDLNDVGELDVYIDGADEITRHLHMIKGGGGALTREKIVAACSRQFVCVADQSKLVGRLGQFPLPVEVVPMARSHVARQLVKLGGQPRLREGFVTDNGNVILDVAGLDILNPVELESEINQIVGVVTNGLFARRPADVLLLGTPSGVEVLRAG